MPETHLKQPGFTYTAPGPFTKKQRKNKKMTETGDSQYIYQNDLDKACFQHYIKFLKMCQEEQQLIKHYVIRHLILLEILEILLDVKVGLPQWFINISIKRLQVILLKGELC